MLRRETTLTGAIAATAAVALASIAYVRYSRSTYKKRRSQLEHQVDNVISHPPSAATSAQLDDLSLPRQFDEDLIQEFLARNYAFFGPQGMHSVRTASVVVVGCGGVGSWAALMLLRRFSPLFPPLFFRCCSNQPRARVAPFSLIFAGSHIHSLSGVSRIRLIDFDLVSLSSLNRHAVATLSDVGTPKVTATKNFFAQVAPWADVDARVELWNDSPHGHKLLQDADWVIGQSSLFSAPAIYSADCP